MIFVELVPNGLRVKFQSTFIFHYDVMTEVMCSRSLLNLGSG
jgi:hypothetical protein